jgi:hypothetical protein
MCVFNAKKHIVVIVAKPYANLVAFAKTKNAQLRYMANTFVLVHLTKSNNY